MATNWSASLPVLPGLHVRGRDDMGPTILRYSSVSSYARCLRLGGHGLHRHRCRLDNELGTTVTGSGATSNPTMASSWQIKARARMHYYADCRMTATFHRLCMSGCSRRHHGCPTPPWVCRMFVRLQMRSRSPQAMCARAPWLEHANAAGARNRTCIFARRGTNK
jgi:hypothetical protein